MSQYTIFAVIITLALSGCSLGKEDIEMPTECEGKTYCTSQPDGYSVYASEIEKFLEESKYWAGIGAQESFYKDLEPHYNVSDGNNCGFITRVEKPYIIKAIVNTTNSETKNKLVVQSKLFTQRINTITCLDKGTSCFEELKAQQDNIETSCEESYTTITIYTFERNKIIPQPFRVPVSCSCKVTFKQFFK